MVEIDGFVPVGEDGGHAEAIPIEFHQQKIVCFNNHQENAIATALPAIVYGPAGSGKTCVALSVLSNHVRMHRHDDEVLPVVYVSQSPLLVETMCRAWKASVSGDVELEEAVIFKTYEELLEDELLGTELRGTNNDMALFYDWYFAIQSKKGAAKSQLQLSAPMVWQEFRIRSGYSAQNYLALGARQSAMNPEDRKIISDLYDAYVALLLSKKMLSPELHSLTGMPRRYSLVVVDEAQDFSFGQLCGLKTLADEDNVLFLLGDHQVLFDGKSRFSFIKSMLADFGAGREVPVIQLPGTYRCSAEVIELTNRLIDLKYKITGGVADKVESTKMMIAEAASPRAGRSAVVSLKNKSALDALKEEARRPNVAVVTFPEYIEEAKRALHTELVFTPKQAKGLEYAKVVVWRPLDCDECETACRKLANTTKTEDATTLHRAKKGRDDESLLPYFNEIITAVTRAQDEVVIVQDASHKISRMYEVLNPAKPPTLADQPAPPHLPRVEHLTTEVEWETEVKKLLKRGLHEQAFNIYIKTLKHSKAEFDAFNTSFQEQQARAKPAKLPSSATPAPVGEKAQAFASAGTGKKPLILVDAKIQQYVTKLIDDFSPKRLAILLASFDMTTVLLCPVRPGENLSLIEYILLRTQNTTALISCILNNYEPSLSPPLIDIIDSTKRRLPVGDRGAIDDLMLVITMLLRSPTQTQCGKLTPAHIAARANRVDIILLLHKYNVDLSKKSTITDVTPALIAARAGYAIIITALHQCGVDFSQPTLTGNTPAFIAAQNGHSNVISALYECGADLNQPLCDGRTPAFIAAQNDHANVITTLHQCGADLNKPANNDATPAFIAAQMGYANVITALHQCGADLNKPANNCATPAFIAAQMGYANVITALHQCEADLNKPTLDGVTPAIVAAANGHTTVMAALHGCGAELNNAMPDGSTPACIAARMDYADIITTLHRCGADLNKQMIDGATPTYIAAEKGHANVITALHQCEADLNQPTPDGVTPACVAAANGHASVIIALHAGGANLNQPKIGGATPTFMAAQNGHENVITTLHQCGADLNRPNDKGATPAYIAAQNGHENAITTLHQCGADLNKPLFHGATPAYIAALMGHANAITALHQGGANLNQPMPNGATPAYIAAANGHANVITVLNNFGANLDQATLDGTTRALIAAQKAHANATTMLHQPSGADLNAPEHDEIKPASMGMHSPPPRENLSVFFRHKSPQKRHRVNRLDHLRLYNFKLAN